MDKIKVAFYLPNKGFQNINFDNYKIANPGIGGSEYAVWLIADELSRKSTSLECYLIVDKITKNLQKQNYTLKYVELTSKEEISEIVISKNIQYLVFCHGLFDGNQYWNSIRGKYKVIVLCECFASRKKLTEYARNKDIVRILAVGQEQLDLYRDHRAFKKSDYIYNPITLEQIEMAAKQYSPSRKSYKVTYMGSLTPAKSFDVLAKAWPKVLKRMPEAQLNVIGGGNLYDRNIKLGKWGLAEAGFEAKFMRYLVDDKGLLLPSVHFFGVLGKEKNEILKDTWVGVPNPTGSSETFGIVTVEMQLAGTLIATKRCPGFLDTVVNPQSVLYDSSRLLAKSIVKLLNRHNETYEETCGIIKEKFLLDKVADEWERLFSECIPNNTYLHDRNKLVNPFFACKWLRELNRRFKDLIHGYSVFPSIMFCESVLYKLKIKKPF